MDVAVSIFAVVVAFACFIAIRLATRKDNKRNDSESEDES